MGKTKAQRIYVYNHGDGKSKYGIWNTVKKEFQLGISESSPRSAENRLFKMIGNDARKWRFETRRLPGSV